MRKGIYNIKFIKNKFIKKFYNSQKKEIVIKFYRYKGVKSTINIKKGHLTN